MKFPDKVHLKIVSGNGGDGCVSGRREKFIAFGGPDGGDGGKGGSVYFVGDEGASSLLKLYYKKQIKANNGEHGKGAQKYGESAKDIFVNVPLGTSIKDKNTGENLGTIVENGQKMLIGRGGKGGWGNLHFKSNSQQYPNFAMYGEPGEKKDIVLELQLIGDVTLIGFPSVGKSSIINTLSNTNVKVADYYFTTLIPKLGVVKYLDKDFTLVDIPGLIEGASTGKGLGNEFLRHILKSKIWTFVVDISRFDNAFFEIEKLKYELESFLLKKLNDEFDSIIKDKDNIKIKYDFFENYFKASFFYDGQLLFSKFIMFVINKIDLVQEKDIVNEFLEQLNEKINFLFGRKLKEFNLVNAGNENLFYNYLNNIVNCLKKPLNKDSIFDDYLLPKYEIIKQKQEDYIKQVSESEIHYLILNDYINEEQSNLIDVFEVFNRKLAYYVYILPWGNKEAEMYFFKIMKYEGVSKYLEQNGVKIGDILKVISPYPGEKNRYIEWKL